MLAWPGVFVCRLVLNSDLIDLFQHLAAWGLGGISGDRSLFRLVGRSGLDQDVVEVIAMVGQTGRRGGGGSYRSSDSTKNVRRNRVQNGDVAPVSISFKVASPLLNHYIPISILRLRIDPMSVEPLGSMFSGSQSSFSMASVIFSPMPLISRISATRKWTQKYLGFGSGTEGSFDVMVIASGAPVAGKSSQRVRYRFY